jgi:quinoprotein glucose dehydrogenase
MAVAGLLLLAANIEWAAYGHDAGGTRHSPAAQINKENVARLKPAWTLDTKDLARPKDRRPSALETTPLYVNGTLFLTSSTGRVIAADPATGAERWSFDPKVDVNRGYGDFTNRGLAWHASGLVIGVSVDARMFALRAKDGRKVWEVNLREGLRIAPREFAEYEETSPPCVIGDVVVVGSAVADNGRTDMPSGEVRGFDVRSGKKLWTWDPIPGSRTGGANAWSVIVADPARELVFVPTGSASPDYYGGARKEKNHANSVVAIEAKTGRMRWAFQTVHHDLWDYDVAAPPLLYRAGGRDAVAVGSKSGFVYLLDRATGEPIFGVDERPVPTSDAEGEEASSTQPVPRKPEALVPQKAELRPECAPMVEGARNEGVFTPPSPRGTIAVPGNIGGVHWGGFAWDPRLELLVAPVNNLPGIIRLIPRGEMGEARRRDRLGMEFAQQSGTPYGMARQFLLGPDGQSCQKGPMGMLAGIDARTGEIRWRTDLTLNLGGPITTAGGLTFLGATVDGKFRAFETESGREVWSAQLPASARSTPMTYVHEGRQYVVVAAGGHDERFGPLGTKVVAFALPD